MEIKVEQAGAAVRIGLAGRLDASTAGGVEETFLAWVGQGAKAFVFDLSGLEYISSAGLRVMLLAAKKMRSAGGKLALFGLGETVREVFEISGFHTIFAIFGSEDDALAFVGNP